MGRADYSKRYDAYYYAHDCGEPYRRDEMWLAFFDGVAQQVVEQIQPATVLDAGCALGFLVEKLRQKGVEASGVDISEYAIQNVHPDVAPYCRVGSVAEPFPQRYDLIVSIEVLEHMPPDEAERAIANFCRYTDDVLFSSTPFDYREVTHINVRAPEYWAERFALQGFLRDVDFDASFLTPWAVRFRRRNVSLHRVVREYERRFWLMWKENVDLRALSTEMMDTLRHQEVEVARIAATADEKATRAAEVEESMGWVVVQKLRALRARFFPPGSRRDQRLAAYLQAVRTRRLIGGTLFFIGQTVGKFFRR